jgi:hypothetical protein
MGGWLVPWMRVRMERMRRRAATSISPTTATMTTAPRVAWGRSSNRGEEEQGEDHDQGGGDAGELAAGAALAVDGRLGQPAAGREGLEAAAGQVGRAESAQLLVGVDPGPARGGEGAAGRDRLDERHQDDPGRGHDQLTGQAQVGRRGGAGRAGWRRPGPRPGRPARWWRRAGSRGRPRAAGRAATAVPSGAARAGGRCWGEAGEQVAAQPRALVAAEPPHRRHVPGQSWLAAPCPRIDPSVAPSRSWSGRPGWVSAPQGGDGPRIILGG